MNMGGAVHSPHPRKSHLCGSFFFTFAHPAQSIDERGSAHPLCLTGHLVR